MPESNVDVVLEALEDLKAKNIRKLCVKEISQITDTMIIATGTSSAHIKAIANNVVKSLKDNNYGVLGTEGEREGDWILVDAQDVMIHIMAEPAREFYALEKLWTKVELPTSQVA